MGALRYNPRSMKFTIRNGPTTLEFEGELEEFNRLADEVDIPADLLARMRTGSAAIPLSDEHDDEHKGEDDDNDGITAVSGSIDVRALHERLATLEAKSDIDRITVMAHEAREAGLEGIDYGTAERLFVELGERKPGRIRATFQNAKARGLVRPAGRGVWAPTVAGENYARLGHRKPRQRSRTNARASASDEAGGGGSED
jgi:hypothetical protein